MPCSRNSSAIAPSGGGASEITLTVWPRARWPIARSSATRSWPPTPNDDSTWTIDHTTGKQPRMVAPASDDELLASIGMSLSDSQIRELRAACARIAGRIHGEKIRVVGFVPSDDRVAVPPLIIHLGLALCDLTGATIAVVDANVRYPGLASIASGQNPDHDDSVFTTRWLRGSL